MKKSYIKPMMNPEGIMGHTLLAGSNKLKDVDGDDLTIRDSSVSGDADARGGSFWDDVD